VSSFNAFESSTAAAAIKGVIQTKIAGSGFALDVVAISGGAQSTGFTNTVKVELLGNTATGVALDAQNCPASFTLLQTVSPNPTISSGRSTVNFAAVSDAWKDVRVRISYPAAGPTVVSCSTDNFAIRPNSLAVSATDTDWISAGTARVLNNSSAGGGVVHKAGQPFTLRATAYNAAAAITGNYAGSPAVQTIACSLPTPTCVNGVLTPGTWSASGGTVTTTSATYTEVGSFNLSMQDTTFAAVDAADTPATCAGYYVCSAAISVGRFVPDHFVANGTLSNRSDLSCTPASTFTYMGEPMALTLTVVAQNAANGTTTNYTSSGGLAKIDGATASKWTLFGSNDSIGLGAVNSATPLSSRLSISNAPSAPSGNWVAGLGSLAANVVLNRGASVDGSFESLNLGIALQDGDGVTLLPGSLNLDADVNAINERLNVGSTKVRYGRIRLNNAIGSDLLTLPVPLTVQYWNGTAWVINSQDNCTQAPVPVAVATTAPPNPGLSFYPVTTLNNLASGDTTATTNTPFVGGNGALILSAPSSAHYGFVDVVIAAPVYLKFTWVSSTPSDPRARATFGSYYHNSNQFIYQRENY
jgi:MSHA biogenesis protein MshQ